MTGPSTADIRKFLTDCFSDEELTPFCFDHFRDVYEGFAAGMAKGQKIQLLLERCIRREALPELLAALERERLEQFRQRFGASSQEARIKPAQTRRGVEAEDQKALQPAPFLVPKDSNDKVMRRRVSPWVWAVACAGLLLLAGVALVPSIVNVVVPPRFMTTAPGATVIPPAVALTAMPTSTSTPSTPTPTPTLPTPTTASGSTQVSTKDGMVMIYLEAGEFLMGSPASDPDADSDEKPEHKVYLDAYWIDRTEVTNAMFARFVEASSYKTDAEKATQASVYFENTKSWQETAGADWRHPRGPSSDLTGLNTHPVIAVSWNDASAYCQWAGRRLPTEAEWEKAARGIDGHKYPWGDTWDVQMVRRVNFADRNLIAARADKNADDGYKFTAPVGSYPAGVSRYGVLDMAGNAWEWVGDWYDRQYYGNSPAQNPLGPTTGQLRVVRGGSWGDPRDQVRATVRGWNLPNFGVTYLGFRCARSP